MPRLRSDSTSANNEEHEELNEAEAAFEKEVELPEMVTSHLLSFMEVLVEENRLARDTATEESRLTRETFIEENRLLREASAEENRLTREQLTDLFLQHSTSLNETSKTNLEHLSIVLASRHGHDDVVKLLLADPRVNPATANNIAIFLASQGGHAAVVQLLLADSRVNPTAGGNNAITCASQAGHMSVVKLLLADPRVDPAANDNKPLLRACGNGHGSVVKLLLADPRVVVTKAGLTEADSNGHESVIDLLVAQPQMMKELCSEVTECQPNGPLCRVLKRWQKRSAVVLLLSVRRNQSPTICAMVSDVLRDAIDEFASFDMTDV